MEKNYENNLSKEQIQKLTEKYREVLEKYEITLEECEVCQFTEFLAKEHPERYDNHMYRSSKELQEICAVINKEKNIAVMINLNEEKNSKIPQGEFGVYDLENHKFEASELIKGRIRLQVEKMSNGTLTAQEQDEMVEALSPKNLDDMEKMATVEGEIERNTKLAVDEKIDEKNTQNGISKEEREQAEKESKEQAGNAKEEKKGQDLEVKKLPEDVVKACKRLGITEIKAFMYASGKEFSDKTGIPHVYENGEKVLVIRAADTSKMTDKYYVFQGDRLCVPGNKDSELEQVVGKPTQSKKDGTFVKPLRIDDEEQYFEFTDSEGMVVKEKIEEDMDLSVQDLENYKKEIEDELKAFAEELYQIENDPNPFQSEQEKVQKYIEANNQFNQRNMEIAQKYGIDLDNVKSINIQTDKYIEQEVKEKNEDLEQEKNEEEEELEAFEVPGKRTH